LNEILYFPPCHLRHQAIARVDEQSFIGPGGSHLARRFFFLIPFFCSSSLGRKKQEWLSRSAGNKP
jgi:hypothetical protein